MAQEPPNGKPGPDGWARAHTASWISIIGPAVITFASPLWMSFNWSALTFFDGSLSATMLACRPPHVLDFVQTYFPRPTVAGTVGYAAWLLFQGLLYHFLPGPSCNGQRTPGGHTLQYTTNGLMAYCLTHLLFLAASVLGIIDPAIIAKHWEGLLMASSVYGLFLSAFVQCKGYWFPSYPADCKSSGSWIFDFFGGVELNPRLGKHWDIKFFHNGRPGIVAWTLIDLSWAAYQREKLGYVTNSMLIVLLLHTIYVVDFFWNEDWYLRTIDIAHDRFGFMLGWGSVTFLPSFYTLQVQYLARFHTRLDPLQDAAILALGLTGYAIFRSANWQRDYVRQHDGRDVTLWGTPAQVIRCTYRTEDGAAHHSLLLASGWWGVCRHTNYLADLMQAAAMCATCGATHLLPWSYFCFMMVLLNHRILRDEEKCLNKYGAKWVEYCKKVPYRLIPGVY